MKFKPEDSHRLFAGACWQAMDGSGTGFQPVLLRLEAAATPIAGKQAPTD